ncbi:hypothetical protein OG252_22785 [Streptomyces sp. NBC_01352]|uniref:Cyclic nucleotide-binding domain-containing protein n=1 Tax=Streptomyces plumbiresistens TaxID=511811 RepID=A0ABP7S7N8_9ACTN|nr:MULTISPECIES: hypothetical protein [unclassified Streptomyces]MCX4698829.1 hypothetical protein [Streptomyces sp. NBC_01373]
MIVSRAAAHAVRQGGPDRRCLARRGMLHSECEAVDHVRLPGGGAVEERGRSGTDEVWLVLSGAVAVEECDSAPWTLRPGELMLSPAGARPRLTAADGGAELLLMAVLPHDRVRRLPRRVPELTRD